MSGQNKPVKRQNLSDWIKEQDPTVCCLQESHFKYKEADTKTKDGVNFPGCQYPCELSDIDIRRVTNPEGNGSSTFGILPDIALYTSSFS